MFDDQPTNQPGGGANQRPPARPTPPNAPSNLPTGGASANEPEDILAGVDKTPAPKAPTPPPAAAPAPSSPPLSAPRPPEPDISVPPSMPPEPPAEATEPFFKRYQKVIVLVVVIGLVGAGLAYGGWYAYNQFFAPSPSQPTVNTNQAATNQNVNAGVNANTNNNVNQGGPVTQPPAQVLDSDRDGLTDEEERLYGTDPLRVDSDNDGLTDRDEVKVFKTDPYNPDTDGDSFIDGAEVEAGYDPKGPGRLLEIPPQ
jgi:hypothetical protein